MKASEMKKFGRILMLIFLGLFAASYASGIIPAGAKEVFLSFLRPSDFDSFSAPGVYLEGVKIAAVETWISPRILIPKISVDAPVLLPANPNLKILNDQLLKGIVRYPGSAMPGATGNVLLFGHSTTLVPRNPMYKVFNRLKELTAGDIITVRSDTREYQYRVKTVQIKQANDAKIDLTSDRKLLTLSTCNIIGGKESRYVVEAEFVKSYSLAK